MKRYKCVLLDDELLALSLLRSLCESIPEIEIVRAYNDPKLFLEQAADLEFDFYFSDIVMPEQNGIDVKSALSDKPVVFCSAHPQFAIDAFDVAAVDFLKKPITLDRLKVAVQKMIEKLEKQAQEKIWLVQTSSGKLAIPTNTIVAISTSDIDARDKCVYLSDTREIMLKNKSFKQIHAELQHLKLIQSTKNTAVNLAFVLGYNGDKLLFSNQWKASPACIERLQHLSDSYKRDFLQAFSFK